MRRRRRRWPGALVAAAALPLGRGPRRYAASVRRHAAAAGVAPQLLMAVLYNESYKPHAPAWQRAWVRLKPHAALGIANMHASPFDEAKRGRDFAGRDWRELPDDPDLAVQAAAWHLHDLAALLPERIAAPLTVDELLALGYNTGARNMVLFARGTPLGPLARAYLDRLRGNWDKAGRALRP